MSTPADKWYQELKPLEWVLLIIGSLVLLGLGILYGLATLGAFFVSFFCFETRDMWAVWCCFVGLNLPGLIMIGFLGVGVLLFTFRRYWLGLFEAIVPLVILGLIWGGDTLGLWTVPGLFIQYQFVKPVLDGIFQIS